MCRFAESSADNGKWRNMINRACDPGAHRSCYKLHRRRRKPTIANRTCDTACRSGYLDTHLRLRSPDLAGLPEDVIGFGFWMWRPLVALVFLMSLAGALSATEPRLKVAISFLGVFSVISIAAAPRRRQSRCARSAKEGRLSIGRSTSDSTELQSWTA